MLQQYTVDPGVLCLQVLIKKSTHFLYFLLFFYLYYIGAINALVFAFDRETLGLLTWASIKVRSALCNRSVIQVLQQEVYLNQ